MTVLVILRHLPDHDPQVSAVFELGKTDPIDLFNRHKLFTCARFPEFRKASWWYTVRPVETT